MNTATPIEEMLYRVRASSVPARTGGGCLGFGFGGGHAAVGWSCWVVVRILTIKYGGEGEEMACAQRLVYCRFE